LTATAGGADFLVVLNSYPQLGHLSETLADFLSLTAIVSLILHFGQNSIRADPETVESPLTRFKHCVYQSPSYAA